MPLDPAALRDGIAAAAARLAKRRLAVAYSGGLDSTVLLDIVAEGHELPLRALHVEHGLQGEQPDWRDAVARNCDRREVPLRVLVAAVRPAAGDSLEAAARAARYAVLAEALAPDELLLVAQHRDDQAETLLLQLLRGAGPAGLAAMPALAPLGASQLLRPLLDCGAEEIAAYATGHGLEWFDDPSNASMRFDRNYLRSKVMPALRARWPGVATTLARAAAWQADAERLAATLAAQDARRIATRSDRVDVVGLAGLDRVRQGNLLRFLCRAAGLSTPDARRLDALRRMAVGPSPRGQVRWPGAEARRYRDRLYLLPPLPEPPDPEWQGVPGAAGTLELPGGYGRLSFSPAALCDGALVCRFRRGGERVRPAPGRPSMPFAAWCQREGVPPWLRSRLPLTFSGDTLAAVGTVAVGDALGDLAPRWSGRPAGLTL